MSAIQRAPISSFRVAPGLEASTQRSGHDPRFHGARGAGDVDEVRWRQKYDFVFDRQRAEEKELKKALVEDKKAAKKRQRRGGVKAQKKQKRLTADEADAVRSELAQKQTERVADEQRAKAQAAKAAARRPLVLKSAGGDAADGDGGGKKPLYFAKRSKVREHQLLAQYEELKKAGKLDKFLAKKRMKGGGGGGKQPREER